MQQYRCGTIPMKIHSEFVAGNRIPGTVGNTTPCKNKIPDRCRVSLLSLEKSKKKLYTRKRSFKMENDALVVGL